MALEGGVLPQRGVNLKKTRNLPRKVAKEVWVVSRGSWLTEVVPPPPTQLPGPFILSGLSCAFPVPLREAVGG